MKCSEFPHTSVCSEEAMAYPLAKGIAGRYQIVMSDI
jgi:hypothetical protein